MPDYTFGPIAVKAHESHSRLRYVWGPIGTAKSSWLCWRVFFKAVQASKQGISLRAVIVRDTYRNLADSTLKTWLRWFPDGSMMGRISRSNPADYQLRTPDGRMHEVLFRHGQTAQDASLFLSTEYGFIGLEEVAPAYLPGKEQKVSPGISEELFDTAYSRLRQEGLAEPEMAITSNPPSRSHWASKRIIDVTENERHGTLRFDLPGLPPVIWEHWFTPISENRENLRAGYYEELTATWPRILVRRFVEGERIDIFVGVPRFDLDLLDKMRQEAIEPSFRGWLRDSDTNILKVRPEANREGWVRMWQEPKINQRYVIGADVAEGLEGLAYSAAYVLNCDDLSIAAAFHGHLGPELYGGELAKLGKVYNNALIGVESNNHGILTLAALKNVGYPRIFFQPNIETRNRKSERLGWQTTTRTRPMMIDGIADYLDSDGRIIDAELINELMTMGIGPDGVARPQEGCFSDRVFAFGIAVQMRHFSGLERIFPALGKRKQEEQATA